MPIVFDVALICSVREELASLRHSASELPIRFVRQDQVASEMLDFDLSVSLSQ